MHDHPRPTRPDWLADLTSILFGGTGPAIRLDAFLDRLEGRA
jgi:hypothetical protein